MDPLHDIITLLRPRAVFSKPITGRGDWGVRYPTHGQPSFCVVLAGQCWLSIARHKPFQLASGDFLLLPTTPAFSLYSQPGVRCIEGRPTATTGVRHGNPRGAPDFRMLGGTFETDPGHGAFLLSLLPSRIHVRSSQSDTSRLARIVALIMEECLGDRPGRELILGRLLEVLLVDSLRSYHIDSDSDNDIASPDDPSPVTPGLLAGLRDPAIARALKAMHTRVRHPWTVAGLAAHVSMSRSAFAARFSDLVGRGPMEYLASWRMSLAQDALTRKDTTLEPLALELGYQSASAFSTAFRKKVGCSPREFVQTQTKIRK